MEIDKLVIEILEDGTIKTTTDEVGTANHDNAEQFLRAMARLAGGETTTTTTHGRETLPSSQPQRWTYPSSQLMTSFLAASRA